jgi:hypothetical protein
MKKLYFIPGVLILSMFFFIGSGLAADKGPPELVLKSTVDPAKRAKFAFFPHAIHQGNFDCGTCHHGKSDDGKQVPYSEGMKIEKCESCHNKAAVASGMPKELETFKKAAHARCKTCHKTRKAEGKNAGPTKCNGCHRKDLK